MSDNSNDMAKLDPQRTALLVMDYQPGILGRIEDSDALTARARKAIATLRDAGATIAYVRVGFEDADVEAMPETARFKQLARSGGDALRADSPHTQVDERVAPQPEDIVVRKVRVGAFSTTDLDAQLRAHGIETLVLAGISTSGVLLSTVRDAHDRDYRQLVLADACADPEPDIHRFLIERILPRQAEVIDVADLAGLLALG